MRSYQFFGIIAAIFMVAQEIHHEVMPLLAAIVFAVLAAIMFMVEETEGKDD